MITQDDILNTIKRNLDEEEVEASEVRVQRDPYSGWQVAIIAEAFADLSHEERVEIALKDLDDVEWAWLDLLTKEEQEWAGPLPSDVPEEEIPLWPEAMARSVDHKESITFLSDLEVTVDRPITTTFYSLRGGVGRSTALGYTARILADRGHTVLCVDMDLEAPGLSSLFNLDDQVRPDRGLVSVLHQMAGDPKVEVDLMNHILRVSETDELYCLPAGEPSPLYAKMLRSVKPEAYYRQEHNPLKTLIDALKNGLTFKPDVILFDARTGINSLSSPLLFDLSDLAFILFFPHPQARKGTEAIIRGLLASYSNRSNGTRLTPEPRFIISPIPASRSSEIVQKYKRRSLEWIQEWLSPLDESGMSMGFYDNLEDLAHFVSYRESVATADAISTDPGLWEEYREPADWIEGFLPSETEEKVEKTSSDLREQALNEFEFPSGTAEKHPLLADTFVNTREVEKALSPDTSLVRGRKGTGKTALFRQLLSQDQHPTILVMAPSIDEMPVWQPGAEEFKSLEGVLKETQTSWRNFWTLYIGIASHIQLESEFDLAAAGLQDLYPALSEISESRFSVYNCLEKLLRVKNIGMKASALLEEVDQHVSPNTLLLFDQLDTGFGNDKADRARRQRAIEGLFSLYLDQESRLKHLRFKILLREDIWRDLTFENKSHLFGRSVQLEWSSKKDFLEVIIRHVLRSEAFRTLAISTDTIQAGRLPDRLSKAKLAEEEVFGLWYLLVGERMRGAKTTYTYNWVWNRLTDGAGNRSPRSLMQLFDTAKTTEKEKDTPYDKSIIRPKALIDSLEEVSQRALSALIDEEFQELKPLVERLREVNYTPVQAKDLEAASSTTSMDERISLAREVGLLEVYEGTETDVKRYKIPDLYRSGIGMQRKGPA